jgi:hypothetical protein
VVLVVPEDDGDDALLYPGEIEPGYYTLGELVQLLRARALNPQAVYFIADLLEP